MLMYTKLWILLEKRGMKRTDLKQIISGNTLAKLGKNETVSSDVIAKICEFLECQPGDIMENVTKKDLIKAGETMNKQIEEMFKTLTVTTGMSKEAILSEFMKEAPAMLEKMKNGDGDYLGISEYKEKDGD